MLPLHHARAPTYRAAVMTELTPDSAEATERIETATWLFDAHDTVAIAGCDGGEPWIVRAFFVEDEPRGGSLDICVSLLIGAERRAALASYPRVAFIVAGEVPDRWVNGIGTAEAVDDDADAEAILKRLAEKAPASEPFLSGADTTAIRVHVERLKVTDLGADPPVTEFTFA